MLLRLTLTLIFVFAAVSTTEAGYLYVLADEDAGNDIYGFHVDESTGELTALAGFPIPTGGAGNDIALVCDRMVADTLNNRLYVINNTSDTVSSSTLPNAAKKQSVTAAI